MNLARLWRRRRDTEAGPADNPEERSAEDAPDGIVPAARRPRRRRRRWARRAFGTLGTLVALVLLAIFVLRFVPPPTNLYQWQEARRLGGLEREWVALSTLPAHVPLSAAAAEDANFCLHWGFDFDAIREALAGGARRGASTVTQQTAKNVFLWQGRSWVRKGLEAGFAVTIEALWGKRRIMEVYLNVAEFDSGVFGIEAAARHHFGVPAARLSPAQTAALMAVLPDPKRRSAVRPTPWLRERARSIATGARTLAVQPRGECVL